jgi:hypothetical protein
MRDQKTITARSQLWFGQTLRDRLLRCQARLHRHRRARLIPGDDVNVDTAAKASLATDVDDGLARQFALQGYVAGGGEEYPEWRWLAVSG